MKLNRLETHDRLQYLKKDQSQSISQGCEDCLKRNSLSLALQRYSPYIYIWAHPRTHDNGVDKVMYWQPRLGKPKAQTNSYLFRAQSNTDTLEICWHIPPREYWQQYRKGNITEDQIVNWSIFQFQHNREELERPYADDYSEDQIREILRRIAIEMDEERRMKQMYATQPKSEES